MDNFDGYIADIYREMEAELIGSMKRNLGLHQAEEALTGLKYPQWQAMKLKELRRFQRENERIMGEKLSGLPDEVSRQMIEELNQGSKHELKRYRKALKKGYKSAAVMKDSFFHVNDGKVQGLINALNNDLTRANSAVLRMMNDQYRQTIFKAGMFVSNGVYTEEQAVKKAIEEFEKKGLNCIEYKDGRRVNIADYTSMAVRTANQRAYMVGEGEFRKSIGETLVIISRHSTSCPLCKPFEGKVLIDDVYSGGTQEDGDYMLLSEAMAQGLYHPRCRHGLGTYYPELEEINGYQQKKSALQEVITPSKSIEESNAIGSKIMAQTYERHRIDNNLRVKSYNDMSSPGDLIYADYGKMSVESANVFNDTIAGLVGEYDTPLQAIRIMTKEEYMFQKNSFAFVSHNYTVDSAELVINPIKCKNIDELSDRIKELSSRGYCVSVPNELAEKYVATHEFAHTILNVKQPLKNSTNWVNANYDKIREARKEISAVYDGYLNEVRTATAKQKTYEIEAITTLDENAWENARKAIQEVNAIKISNYSLTDVDEFLAESFANEKLGTASNPYSKQVVDIIDKYFKR